MSSSPHAFERGLIDIDRLFREHYPKEISFSTMKAVIDERMTRRYNILPDVKQHYTTILYFRTFGRRLFVDSESIAAASAAGDARSESVVRMLRGALKWAAARGLKVPASHFFVSTADNFVWEAEEIGGTPLPIAAYSRPVGVPVVLFPDITWNMFTPFEKYGGEMHTWDDTVRAFDAARVPWEKRRPDMYFKGTDTTRRNLGIRSYLRDMSRSSTSLSFPLTVKLDAWGAFEPVTKLSEHKVLLDLPGHYSWSNRLKYLALAGSPIVRVTMDTTNVWPDTYDDKPHEQLIDFVIESGKDYSVVNTTWYRCGGTDGRKVPPPLQRECDRRNADELGKLPRLLAAEYRAALARVDDAERLAEKVRAITLDDVYAYVYHFIVASSRVKWTKDANLADLKPLSDD